MKLLDNETWKPDPNEAEVRRVAVDHALATRWRSEAAILRRRGAEAQALLLESCADDLVEYEVQYALEPLSMEDSVGESGYSRSGLDKLMDDGSLENVGIKGRPLLRRGDLPRKPGRLGKRRAMPGEPELAGSILAARGA